MTLKQLQEWGWEDEMERYGDDPLLLGHIILKIKIKGVEFVDLFFVSDSEDNLIGVKTLYHFNSIIDLENHKLIFRNFTPEVELRSPTTTVNIEGQDVMLMIDTGCTDFVHGPMDLAQKLNLKVEDVSHMNLTLCGIGYKCRILYKAYDVCVKAFGQEKRGTFVVYPDDIPAAVDKMPILGIQFFWGAKIQYNPDRTLEVIFPDEDVQVKPAAYIDIAEFMGSQSENPSSAIESCTINITEEMSYYRLTMPIGDVTVQIRTELLLTLSMLFALQ